MKKNKKKLISISEYLPKLNFLGQTGHWAVLPINSETFPKALSYSAAHEATHNTISSITVMIISITMIGGESKVRLLIQMKKSFFRLMKCKTF